MQTLIPLAEIIAARLIERGETVGVGESSTGGLISAALLAVPGASAYFRGGGVIYTPRARAALVNITKEEMEGMRALDRALCSAAGAQDQDLLGTTWGLSETGATGPSGNRYGDAAGHSCSAVVGPTRAGHDHRDRQRRPAGQYAHLRAAGRCNSLAEVIGAK